MLTYHCKRTSVAPPLDGSMPAAVWDPAESVALVLTESGADPVQATRVRLLYDVDFLYAGFEAVDTDVWGTFTQRKDPVCSQEAVEVFLDPAASGHFYVEIEVSPLNTIYDLYNLNDPRCSPAVRHLEDWTCVGLRTAVQVDGELNSRRGTDTSWTCVMAIPHNEMVGAPHIPPEPGDIWHMNLYRIDRPRTGEDEYTAWVPTGAIDYHRPDKFGKLLFA